MSYIDAGYAIALSVLFVYAGLLWVRRRRLEHLALGARDRMKVPGGVANESPVHAATPGAEGAGA